MAKFKFNVHIRNVSIVLKFSSIGDPMFVLSRFHSSHQIKNKKHFSDKNTKTLVLKFTDKFELVSFCELLPKLKYLKMCFVPGGSKRKTAKGKQQTRIKITIYEYSILMYIFK